MEKLLISSFILSLIACTNPAQHPFSLPEGLARLASTPELACRYEKQMIESNNPQKTNWYFWRQEQRTETRDELSNQGEIWEYKKPGEFFYTRLFYNESVALEFVPGDLATTGTVPSLQQLTSLVDPKMFGKELTLISKGNNDGLPIEYYSGIINNIATEVDWLPALNLPARLVKKLPEGTVALTLSECYKGSKFSVKSITKAQLDEFRRLDYTDLGDMEDDPMVQHIEQLLGSHHNN
jgi:hypothetical protein